MRHPLLILLMFGPALGGGAAPLPLPRAHERVAREVEEIRGLPFLDPFAVAVESRRSMRREARREWGSAKRQTQILQWAKIYRALGLLPERFDFPRFFRKSNDEDQTAYAIANDVTVQRKLFEENPDVLAHELVHVLQFQHFRDLLEGTTLHGVPSDQIWAQRAFIEGEASYVQKLFRERRGEPPLPKVHPRFTLDGTTPLRMFKVLPYRYGRAFVEAAYERGGWELVGRIAKAPPTSTEQILHPEKYFEGPDEPLPVEDPLPEAERLLGRELLRDRIGEWTLRCMLEVYLRPLEAAEAAAGWGGDEIFVGETGDGKLSFLLATVWDTPRDARQFFEAYVRRTEARFSGRLRLSRRSPADFFALTPDLIVRLFASGSRVSVFETPRTVFVPSLRR